MSVRVLVGDVRARLAELADESVHCVVTSPPYFGLRDYGVDGQIGLEPTPAGFVSVMVEVFREVRRVLRKDGTCWVNLGDSYAGGGTIGRNDAGRDIGGGGNKLGSGNPGPQGTRQPVYGLKPKDLIGIPWRVAFALQADGWYLRQDIIWHKPNPMPESVTDRCTKAHEYLFLLSRSPRYHYDAEAIAESVAKSTIDRFGSDLLEMTTGKREMTTGKPEMSTARIKSSTTRYGGVKYGKSDDPKHQTKSGNPYEINANATRNRRSVWTVATEPFKEAHFATFPPALIEPCILAGCPKDACAKCGAPVVREVEKSRTFESGSGRAGNMPVGKNGANLQGGRETGDIRRGPVVHVETAGWSPTCTCAAGLVRGTVLDPFGGAGTTGLVTDRLQRSAVLIELNPEYAELARSRIHSEMPMFADVAAE